MKLLFKILAILLFASVIGNLIKGKIFLAGLVIGLVFAYFGFKEKEVANQKDKANNDNLKQKKFSDRFDLNEKLSIIRLCWLIVGVDETSYLQSQSLMKNIYFSLDLPFTSETLQKSRTYKSEYCCFLLKKHSEIDWIIYTLYGVTYSDEQVNKDKEKLFKMYADGLEFDNDKLNLLLKKINQFDDLINPSTINQ